MAPRLVDGVLLALAVLLVVGVTYIPHLDTQDASRSGSLPAGLLGLTTAYGQWILGDEDDYEYPLHVDENHHWAFMAQLQRDETLRFDHPYTGAPPSGLFGLKGSTHEKGFHLAVAQFQSVTGVPWPVVIRFLPAVSMGVVAWGLWAFLRPWPGAPLAAAFVALVPTSDRFIGPGFLVPIGLGLLWIPVAALLARQAFDERRSSLLMILVVGWAFFIHFIAGLAALVGAAAVIPWSRHRRHAAVLLAVSLVPVLWLLKTFIDELRDEATKYGEIPVDRGVFDQLGTLFLVLAILGMVALFYFPPRDHRVVLCSFAAVAAITLFMIGTNLAFHLHNYFLYERWHQPFALFATVPAAHMILTLGRSVGDWPVLRRHQAIGVALVGLAAVGAMNEGVQGHLREPYYHLVDEQDWASYTWAAEHLPGGYSTFLAHPWKAPVINAMTGKHPVTVLYPGSPPDRGDIFDSYRGGASRDGAFLVLNDITWVVDTVPVDAPEFTALGPDIYGLKEPYLSAYVEAVSDA